MDVDEFFAEYPESRQYFDLVHATATGAGPCELRVTRSQVAFARSRAFAWVWVPEMYLRRQAAPLVLTFNWRARDPSPRWKEIVEPRPGRFTHHLELWSFNDVDGEVRTWLKTSWQTAG